jgi:hypothetical protein
VCARSEIDSSPDSDLVFVPEFLASLDLGLVKTKDFLNSRLFPVFPKLVHFSPQTIEIRENHGLSYSAFPEFDFKVWNASRFNRNRVYEGIWVLKLVREPSLEGGAIAVPPKTAESRVSPKTSVIAINYTT